MNWSIPLAILDDPPVRPERHVFVDSKSPWFEITDKLPQYARYAPNWYANYALLFDGSSDWAYDRFGSTASFLRCPPHVRFTPDSVAKLFSALKGGTPF
jgi:hypothetical protein